MEIGSIDGFALDDISVEGTLFGMNLRNEPLKIERREDGRWIKQIYPPNGMWLYPEGNPLSFRHRSTADWA
jgi:hypothetical protein